eukprot:701281-Prorocentrum_minimum.AAC.1
MWEPITLGNHLVCRAVPAGANAYVHKLIVLPPRKRSGQSEPAACPSSAIRPIRTRRRVAVQRSGQSEPAACRSSRPTGACRRDV